MVLVAASGAVNVYTSSSTVSILAIIAAVTAAVIAPVVTGIFLWRNTGRNIAAEETRQTATLRAEETRQRTALGAEQERLARTLGAEDQRLRERLAFERSERDLAELREILDALAGHLFALWALVNQLYETSIDKVMRDPRKDRAWEEHGSDLRSVAGKIRAVSRDVADQVERLRLRLGDSGDRLQRLATGIREQSEKLALAIFEELPIYEPDTAYAAMTEQFEGVKSQRQQFVDEALGFTKARLQPPLGQGGSLAAAK